MGDCLLTEVKKLMGCETVPWAGVLDVITKKEGTEGKPHYLLLIMNVV